MPRGRPRIDEERRREALIQAGRTVFLELGYYATTADMIIERCKVSKRTFYEIFEDKADLLIELLDIPNVPLLTVPKHVDGGELIQQLNSMFSVDEVGTEYFRYFLVRAAWEARDSIPLLNEEFEEMRSRIKRWLSQQRSPKRIADPATIASMILNVAFGRSPNGQRTQEARIECVAFVRSCFGVIDQAITLPRR